MALTDPVPNDLIECPLCEGWGHAHQPDLDALIALLNRLDSHTSWCLARHGSLLNNIEYDMKETIALTRGLLKRWKARRDRDAG